MTRYNSIKCLDDYFTYFIVGSLAEPAFCDGKCSGGNKYAEIERRKKNGK